MRYESYLIMRVMQNVLFWLVYINENSQKVSSLDIDTTIAIHSDFM